MAVIVAVAFRSQLSAAAQSDQQQQCKKGASVADAMTAAMGVTAVADGVCAGLSVG